MRIKIIIAKEKCKGCELCVSVCKRKVLEMSSERETNQNGYRFSKVTDPEKCAGCVNCAIICPDTIIEIYKEENNN